MNKKILSVLMSLAILVTLPLKVYAEDKTIADAVGRFMNLEEDDCDKEAKKLVTAIMTGDTGTITANAELFKSGTYDTVMEITNEHSEHFINGKVKSITTEYAYAYYTSTGDQVMMVTVKVLDESQSYNCMYLFEFHQDFDGVIYGFNLWAF